MDNGTMNNIINSLGILKSILFTVKIYNLHLNNILFIHQLFKQSMYTK